MEAIEIMNTWKLQDTKIDESLNSFNFKQLLHQKSNGVLAYIRRILFIEIMFITILWILCNTLYFLTGFPFSFIRWAAFILFNIFMLINLGRYIVTILGLRLNYNEDITQTLRIVIRTLTRYKKFNWLFRLPFAVIVLCMFGIIISQVAIIPWMIAESFIWWWLLGGKLNRRFHRYVDELSFSLRVLVEV